MDLPQVSLHGFIFLVWGCYFFFSPSHWTEILVQVLLLTNILRINKVDRVVQRLHVPLISREKSGLYHLAVERARWLEVFRKYWGSKGKPVPRGRTTCAYNQQNAPNLLGEPHSWARTLSSLNAGGSEAGAPWGRLPARKGRLRMDGLVLHPSWISSCPRPSISLSPCPHLSLGLMVELPDLKVSCGKCSVRVKHWTEVAVSPSLGEHRRRDSVTIYYKSDGRQVGLGLLEPLGTRAQG